VFYLLIIFQECHDVKALYLSAQDVLDHSRLWNSPDAFKDLYMKDFVMAVGHRARRQFCQVNLGLYSIGLLKCGLDHKKTKEWPGVNETLLARMEYTASVGVMSMMEVVDVNQWVDEIKTEVMGMGREVEVLSGMRQEVMKLGVELMEARGEMEDCHGAMMMMRNTLTDVMREFQDARVDWFQERDLLIQIQSSLLRCLEVVERQVGSGSMNRPIVIEDSEDSGNNGDVETALGDEISLWARNMAELVDNTLVENQIVYDLVPIEELTRSN
jgi:hypothetical protein